MNKLTKIVLGVIIGLVILGGGCCGGTIILGSVLPPAEATLTLVPSDTLVPTIRPTNTPNPQCGIHLPSTTLYIIFTGPDAEFFCNYLLSDPELNLVRVTNYPETPVICGVNKGNDTYFFVIDTDPNPVLGIYMCSELEE